MGHNLWGAVKTAPGEKFIALNCYATKALRSQINNLSFQLKKQEEGVQIWRKEIKRRTNGEIVNRKTIINETKPGSLRISVQLVIFQPDWSETEKVTSPILVMWDGLSQRSSRF